VLAPGSLVRVVWPNSPLHGRRGLIDKEVTVEGLDRLGATYAVYVASIHVPIVLRADQLVPEGKE
jgi:hypothetical protein